MASQQKPVMMSTGASSLPEIRYAVSQLEKYGASEICILHCVLNYPTPYEHAGLRFIKTLRKEFSDFVIGYSDHVKPDQFHSALTVALEHGATVIEKHYTFDKTLTGNDHYHSFNYNDLVSFTQLLDIRRKLGLELDSDRLIEADAIKHARRSIYTARPLEQGIPIQEIDLICLRPGDGISPVHFDNIIGQRPAVNLPANHKLSFRDLEG